MAASTLLNSSIGRKVTMALSGVFLISFLALHVSLNMTSVIDRDTFNSVSHFMGYNPVVQYLLQPILAFGVFFHFIAGIALELKNRRARPIGYVVNNGSANSTWASRNMIVSGLVILAYFGLHWYDFWFRELDYKFLEQQAPNATRYYDELVHKFKSPIRTGLYCVAFVLLGVHLWHGVVSSLQSIGFNNQYARALSKLGRGFAIVVPAGFIVIALYHHFGHLNF
ncbi:succinate dehydrogenase cytochrome b subunit [Spirosoma foliorum]|uniref:Succinate dehydrogenase cytochrome b subunit n=1 Tax=Spirosoma foliorum TaxID=2710596 RepID=A0A7G5H341_9BACT|nr:succinate dehydrogenase cytochrome b subunit [Spirosoma foliorum]QMW05533.1 succinate dehydrogenase cytochrome b subunit [Spirosoma foliorum]